jgi:superfamily II DNA/RNA helicase
MPVVINYDVPMNPEDYVHRIGRTGRAGRKGRAFTLVTPDDARYLAAIEKLTKRTIPRLALGPQAAPSEAAPTVSERPRRDRRPAASPVEATGRRRPAPTTPREAPAVRTPREPIAARRAGEAAPSPRREPASRPEPVTRRAPAIRREPSEERPVVAFGEHVPRFLLTAPPLRKAS